MTSLLCISAGCFQIHWTPCQDPWWAPLCPSLPFTAPEQGVGVKGAPSPCPQCPQHTLLSSACPCLTARHSPGWKSPGNQLTITQPSPATPTPHLPCSSWRPSPGHILMIQAHPHFPGQRGVCPGSICPGTSGPQGTETCFLIQACSQGSLKLPSPG